MKLTGPYGYFDPANREYVITRPDTPVPWFNYVMSSEESGWVGLISHTGGGPAYRNDARNRRVLRYRYNGIPVDRPGRWVYLRDDSSGTYWSAQYQPVARECESFETRVGVMRQTVTTVCEGIRAKTTYFAAPDDPVEIWWLELENMGRRPRKISTFSYAEFAVWGAMRDLVNIDNASACADIVVKDGAIVHRTMNDLGSSLGTMNFVNMTGWLAADRKAAGFDTDRDLFLGRWRDESNPETVERGKTNNTQGRGRFPLGCLHHRLTIRPGRPVSIVYQLGAEDDARKRKRLIAKYRKPKNVRKALDEVKAGWEAMLSKQQARTPDGRFDAVFNTWNPYQSTVTYRLSRSLSPYERGMSRGVGYRDTSQDVMAQSPFMPDAVEKKYEMLLANQFADGRAIHNFFPRTGEGTDTDFFDDHLWPVLGVCHLVAETGGTKFLKRTVKFRDRGKATVRAHLERSLDASWKRRGPHGLMRVGNADWNDSLNPGHPQTESVFTSCLYCRAASDFADLMEGLGDAKAAAKLRKRVATVASAVNDVAWDGAWYRRLIFPDGSWLGGRRNRKAGMIFLEPQAWAVMSGVATPARARKCMDSVRKLLYCRHGVRLVVPPFTEYDPEVGAVGIVSPGIKENGAVFNHTNPWAIIAETMLGGGERAYEYHMTMSPATLNERAETYENEPYVFSQHTRVRPFRYPGMGRNSWLTGTASWSLMAMAEHILGVRPELAGLRIDPCVPKKWRRFDVDREFRGTKLRIRVENPKGVSKGVRRIVVADGVVAGNLLPAELLARWRGKELAVKVLMG